MQSTTVNLTLPYPPSANVYWRSVVFNGKKDDREKVREEGWQQIAEGSESRSRRSIFDSGFNAANLIKPKALTFVSEEAKEYKAKIERLNNHRTPLVGDLIVTVKVYRKIRSGDLDNRLKVLFDAMQGTVYVSDSQIVEIHAFRFDSPNNPRVEVEIEERKFEQDLFPAFEPATEQHVY